MDPARLLGYVEAHIEQGPVLEEEKLAVGIVTAIAGQSRFQFSFTGRAGHAGTTPMRLRRDALCAAAEFILAVERYAARKPGLVATVGQIQAEPNASNVIPGTVSLDAGRAAPNRFRPPGRGRAIPEARPANRLCAPAESFVAACPADAVGSLLAQAVRPARTRRREHQRRIVRLPSGAGHDAAILARITPAAMLFVRCKGGISHHPDESASRQDVRVALAVLNDFLRLMAREYGRF